MGYDLTEFSKLNKWYEKLQTLPGMDENNAGAKMLAGMLKSMTEGQLF